VVGCCGSCCASSLECEIGSWTLCADTDRRTNIEEEYAQKLAKLAKVPIGVEEVG
jgi:hypothetical protein